jgi:hypothetical protein
VIGLFRVRLLYGLQNAGYEPVEFIVIPPTKLLPSPEELEKLLFTSESPPVFHIESSALRKLECERGEIESSANGAYILSWSHQEREFKATLFFENFSIPVRWRPHIFRAGVSSSNNSLSWSNEPIVLPDTALTFSARLYVEALPNVKYQIYVNEDMKQSGQFDASGQVDFPLALFSEFARKRSTDELLITMRIFEGTYEYQLSLLKVLTSHSSNNGEASGALISRMPRGQPVIHPDYGLGFLSDFTEKQVGGHSIEAARFHFHRYENVRFFIPIVRRIPLFWR